MFLEDLEKIEGNHVKYENDGRMIRTITEKIFLYTDIYD